MKPQRSVRDAYTTYLSSEPTRWTKDEWPDDRLRMLEEYWFRHFKYYQNQAKEWYSYQPPQTEKKFLRWLFTRGDVNAQILYLQMKDRLAWQPREKEYKVIYWGRLGKLDPYALRDASFKWHSCKIYYRAKRLFVEDLNLEDLTLTRWKQLARAYWTRTCDEILSAKQQQRTELAISQLRPPPARTRSVNELMERIAMRNEIYNLCPSK